MREPQDKTTTEYFQRRTTSHISEMRQAKKAGLFPKREGWKNVVEHMVVEAEAADVLAEALGLSEEERKQVYKAGLLHDVYKRREKEIATQKGSQGYIESASLSSDFLRSQGYSEEIIALTQDAGSEAATIEFNKNFDSISTVRKIIRYVDDITKNNDLVALDERMDALDAKPNYKELNEKGRVLFGGRTYFEIQREISKKIEREFADKIGLEDPAQLPFWIRDRIFSRINK